MTSPTRRARRRVLDAPHLPVAVYLGFVGALTLVQGPTREMSTIIPPWLNVVWAAGLVAGAALICWGIAGEASRAESTGHAFHLFGLGLFTVVHLAAFDGADVVVVAVLAAVSLLRMRVLRRSRAARREAGRLLTNGGSS